MEEKCIICNKIIQEGNFCIIFTKGGKRLYYCSYLCRRLHTD